MTTPIPTARPNPLRTQLLGALVDTKTGTRSHKALGADGEVVTAQVPTSELRFPLAANVSELNVERAARRWGK